MSRARGGSTLFELILVLTLLVILAAISYPTLDAMYGSVRVTASADEVRAAWAQARAHAMNEGVPYRFSIVPNKGNYRVAPDLADFWAGKGEPPQPSDPNNPPMVLEAAVTKGVRLIKLNDDSVGEESGSDTIVDPGTVDPNSYVTVVTFLPDGTAREDVELRLRVRGARPLILRLRGLTGVITSRWSS